MKEKITFTEFLELEKKLEIKVGTIENIEDVPKSSKLLKLGVDFGDGQLTQVVTNIKSLVTDEMLIGLQFLFITNLEPTKIMGIDSFAMIMPGQLEDKKPIHAISENGTILL